MTNSCNYSDNWQPYTGEYDKFEYDIKLKDGTIVENCYPSAGKFISISPQHDQQSFADTLVEEIRFSEKPRYLIDNPFSEHKADPEYVKAIDEQIEQTRSEANEPATMQPKLSYKHFMPRKTGKYKRPKGFGPQVKRESPKVGRNELCPCGSGKKYKKCCGA